MMNSRVFMGNLAPDDVTRQEIEQLFSEYGKVLGVSLHKTYGFVQFADEKSAQNSIKALNGHTLHGLSMELNIATERRPSSGPHPRGGGGGSGRRPGPLLQPRSPPSPRFRGRYEPERGGERYRPMERYSRHSPPPPPYHDDPYHRDPFYRERGPPLRDPYARPRDDPYDRYDPPYRDRYPPPPPPPPARNPYPPPMRDYPPQRDYPPPRRPPPPKDYVRDLPPKDYVRDPPPLEEPSERTVDMEIIVVNRQQKEYAEMVRSRVVNLGLLVEMVYLSPTVSLADALDNATQRGLLYAIIITSQHEMHRSTTLTILHGRNPQEHKNMPLEDALGLVDRDFIRYNQGVRDGHIIPRKLQSKKEVNSLLAKAASGEQLDSSQLQAVISALQKQQHSGPASGGKRLDEIGGLPKSSTDDIQRQQADLQAKILSLLGSRAVVPSTASAGGQSFSGGGGGNGAAIQGRYEGGNVGSGYHDSGGFRDMGGASKYDSFGYGYR